MTRGSRRQPACKVKGQSRDIVDVLELQIRGHRIGLIDLGLQAVVNGAQLQLGTLNQDESTNHAPIIPTQMGCDLTLTGEGPLNEPKVQLLQGGGLKMVNVS